jgi:hypothetical protein
MTPQQLQTYQEALRLALVALKDISRWDSVDVMDLRKFANYTIEHVERLVRESE